MAAGAGGMKAETSSPYFVPHSFNVFASIIASHAPMGSLLTTDPDTAGAAGGAALFLTLPCKRNCLFQDRTSEGAAMTAVGKVFQVFTKPSYALPNARPAGYLNPTPDPYSAPRHSPDFLDFRSLLLPSIQAALEAELPDITPAASLDPSSASFTPSSPPVTVRRAPVSPFPVKDAAAAAQARAQFAKTVQLWLPTEAQWQALNRMRIHAGAPERSEQGAEKVLAYYAQLEYLEQKFPLETNTLNPPFTWTEAHYTSRPVETRCIQYEKAATCYNLAALYSQMAGGQRGVGEMRGAGILFRKAAGALQYLLHALVPRIRIRLDRSSDLSEGTLRASIQVMLAQAAECVYIESERTKCRSELISKLAHLAASMYSAAYDLATREQSVTWARFPKLWVSHLKTKNFYLQAVAQFHCPTRFPADLALGERIARLREAKKWMEKAVKTARGVGGGVLEPRVVGGGIIEAAEAHLELISTTLTLAETANHSTHHQSVPDSRLLAPPQLPPSHLVMPAQWNTIAGDISRFSDIFSGVVAPNVWGDMKKFVGECGRVVEEGRRELSQAKVEIQTKLSALDLSNLGKTPAKAPEPAKVPASAAALLTSLKAHQKEESILSSQTLLPTLTQLLGLSKQNLREAQAVLETVDGDCIRDEGQKVDIVLSLRQAVGKVKESLASSEKKVHDLDRRWGAVDGLGVEQWSEEKMKAIIPSLDPKRAPPPAHSRDKVDEIKKERDSLARRAEELKKKCEEKLMEMAELGADVDKAPPSVDLHMHMQARRRQLKLLEEAVATIRKEKETVLKKVEEVSSSVKTQTARLTEHEEEMKTIESFRSGLEKYAAWREEAQAEVDCLKLPTKPRPPGSSGGFGAAFRGILGRASSVANLLANPAATDRDPMVLAKLKDGGSSAKGKEKEKTREHAELSRSDTETVALAIRGLPDKDDDFLLLLQKDMEDGGSPVSIKRVIFEPGPKTETSVVSQVAAPAVKSKVVAAGLATIPKELLFKAPKPGQSERVRVMLANAHLITPASSINIARQPSMPALDFHPQGSGDDADQNLSNNVESESLFTELVKKPDERTVNTAQSDEPWKQLRARLAEAETRQSEQVLIRLSSVAVQGSSDATLTTSANNIDGGPTTLFDVAVGVQNSTKKATPPSPKSPIPGSFSLEASKTNDGMRKLQEKLGNFMRRQEGATALDLGGPLQGLGHPADLAVRSGAGLQLRVNQALLDQPSLGQAPSAKSQTSSNEPKSHSSSEDGSSMIEDRITELARQNQILRAKMQQGKREQKEDQERFRELMSKLQEQEERLSKLEEMKAQKESERRAKLKALSHHPLIGSSKARHSDSRSSGRSARSQGARKTAITVTEQTLEQSFNGGWHVVGKVTTEYEKPIDASVRPVNAPATVAQLISRVPAQNVEPAQIRAVVKPVPVVQAKLIQDDSAGTRQLNRSSSSNVSRGNGRNVKSDDSSEEDALAARRKAKKKAAASKNLWELAANEHAAASGKPPISPDRKTSNLLASESCS
ncbi:BRO1-domain-containing protein [Gonapodya prolifera JEL478]|uniref:BRO domain-containing protein 1 n=1 Tax=Gonapodya prolifera (strain JEL478) TaxID=1344416 RepID=A0A139ALL7_GONPJ|nr:BRO1-domain-containing protein [Gonapodya prolifera JEL478]|eukprot:KXS17325.1 BRO1-domain-containing protein [Gonapodya prolifera JEL478]